MKLHRILIIGIALSATGCAETDRVAADQSDEAQAPVAEAPSQENERWRKQAFLKHMHDHAEKLDQLNFALADGDLESAQTQAFWLSRHKEVSGIPSDWQPYLNGMREAAQAVEAAPDLAAARAPADRITGYCQGCHAAAGITGK